MPVKLIDQFVGAMMGLMVGDALGRPAKEHTPQELNDRPDIGTEMIGGFYTEDTEMMINVAETLLEFASIDQNNLAARLGEQLNPMRGYNPGALEVLYRFQQGMDWRDANREVFEDGSFGIGGSPRAVPVGLLYHTDLDAVIENAEMQAEITHAHPIGQAGAVTVALSVALAVQRVPVAENVMQVQDLLVSAGYPGLEHEFDLVHELLDDDPTPQEIVQTLGGNALTVQFCVPAALYCVQRHANSFEAAVGFACRLGGDADSIAAVTGAILGAYHGIGSVPTVWLNALENEDRGRDFVLDLAQRLYALWQERFSGAL